MNAAFDCLAIRHRFWSRYYYFYYYYNPDLALQSSVIAMLVATTDSGWYDVFFEPRRVE